MINTNDGVYICWDNSPPALVTAPIQSIENTLESMFDQ